MSQPLSQLDIFGTGTQGQEVSLHIQRGVLLLEEILGRVIVLVDGRGAVHREGRVDGGGMGHDAPLSWICHGSLVWGTVVHLGRVVFVVTSPAKPLATR